MKYIIRGDSLIFWGTGDPSFLRKGRGDGTVYRFLKNSTKDLYFSDSNFQNERFGPAWGWNWYTASWAKERTPLPMYGNAVHFYSQKITSTRPNSEGAEIRVAPSFFTSYLTINKHKDSYESLLARGEVNNEFRILLSGMTAPGFLTWICLPRVTWSGSRNYG